MHTATTFYKMDVKCFKFVAIFCLCQLKLIAYANPLISESMNQHHSGNSTQTSENSRSDHDGLSNECDVKQEITHGDFRFLANGNVFVMAENATYQSSQFRIIDGKLFMCDPDATTEAPILSCETFEYEPHEFQTLSNGSILLGDELLPDGIYKIKDDGNLIVCTSEYDESDINATNIHQGALGAYYEDTVLIYIGKVGSGISVAALTAHLVIFCIVPTLRNLPGYNLACFSFSLLIAYAFVLIGQIPEVLGASCVASAIMQQNFFLSVFFWMNAMAFDVWRTLRLATEQLVVPSSRVKSMRFFYYCLYAWGCPLVITGVSVVFDNVRSVPQHFKPDYGKYDICWMSNVVAKSVFFMFPSFVLFVMNGIFYGLSARILFSNTMRVNKDDRKAVKLNFVLYARVAVIMGMTWLLSLVAAYTMWRPIWYLFDILNSLQGLFVFVFFSCSRKVWQYLKKTPETTSKDSSKNTNSTGTKSETVNRNSDIAMTNL